MLALLCHVKGYILEYEGLKHRFDSCLWNRELAKFHLTLGKWMQRSASGMILEQSSEYFGNINNSLQQARDEYYNYLYSVTNPYFRPGVDFRAVDLHYILIDSCRPPEYMPSYW